MRRYDFIVIGSGFGGSVAAYKLAKAGADVAMLERGPWRDTNVNAKLPAELKSPLPYGKYFYSHLLRNASLPGLRKKGMRLNTRGLYEFFYHKEMSVLCSSGVGGGSHVYSAMNVRPAVKNYWRRFLEPATATQIDQHYDWMIHKMGATPPNTNVPGFIAHQPLAGEQLMAHAKQPAMSVKLNRDSSAEIQANSFFGAPSGNKATLDRVLINDAVAAGLVLKPLHEAVCISRCGQGGDDYYLLQCFDHQRKRFVFLQTKKVILAAGTLNTVRLLFRSRDQGGLQGMPALGMGFAGNGDFPAYWSLNQTAADYSRGLPCHGRLGVGSANSEPNITAYGFNGFMDIPIPGFLKRRLKQNMVLVGMGADNNSGVFTWHKGRLGLRYIPEQQAVLHQIADEFNEIARLGQRPVFFTRRRYLTVHPLGGAVMGGDTNVSVVNAVGEVHDNPGLYVADAAALPAAPGSPPSMTIAAWSAHVSEHLLNDALTQKLVTQLTQEKQNGCV